MARGGGQAGACSQHGPGPLSLPTWPAPPGDSACHLVPSAVTPWGRVCWAHFTKKASLRLPGRQAAEPGLSECHGPGHSVRPPLQESPFTRRLLGRLGQSDRSTCPVRHRPPALLLNLSSHPAGDRVVAGPGGRPGGRPHHHRTISRWKPSPNLGVPKRPWVARSLCYHFKYPLKYLQIQTLKGREADCAGGAEDSHGEWPSSGRGAGATGARGPRELGMGPGQRMQSCADGAEAPRPAGLRRLCAGAERVRTS